MKLEIKKNGIDNALFFVLKVIVLIGVLFVFTACLKTRAELEKEEKEREMHKQLMTLQRGKAEYSGKLIEYDDEFRRVKGKVDEVDKKVLDLSSEHEKKYLLLEKKLLEQEKTIALLLEALEKLEKGQNKQVPSSKTEKKMKGNFAQAEIDFEKKNWKDAILGYQNYRDLNPGGKNYSKATYMIGVCFQELNMMSEAKAFYQEVLDKFSKSSWASKAKYRLNRIK